MPSQGSCRSFRKDSILQDLLMPTKHSCNSDQSVCLQSHLPIHLLQQELIVQLQNFLIFSTLLYYPRKREITASIVRNMDKCIFCRRCESVCNDVQTVGALSAIRRGFNTTIAPAFDRMMTESECTYCGQCVAVCPVGALTERDYTNRLLDDLANPDKVVIVQTAPAVRAALGEEFGFPPGTVVTGKMVYALRELGFDYVFDTDFAADLTISSPRWLLRLSPRRSLRHGATRRHCLPKPPI